jgi:hypothetical protein
LSDDVVQVFCGAALSASRSRVHTQSTPQFVAVRAEFERDLSVRNLTLLVIHGLSSPCFALFSDHWPVAAQRHNKCPGQSCHTNVAARPDGDAATSSVKPCGAN